jgi:cell division protein FtsI (penicillin-binding protein 3)
VRDMKRRSVPDASSRWLRLRVRLLGFVFLALLGAIFARAVNLQVYERERLASLARDQYVRQIEIPARRGDIFDRRGAPLAQSVEVDSIWVDPSLLPDVGDAVRTLARLTSVDARELRERLERGRRFAWVKRQARPGEVAAVQALGWRGIGVAKEPRRFYPQRELAAHVLGVAGTDGKGLDGLELAFNDELTGQSSRVPSYRDARGRNLLTQARVEHLERSGAAVTLTLDRHLQYVAEKAITRAVTEAKATAGMVVVLDPRSGELLAVANYPTFNPNMPGEAARHVMKNRAALDTFEPGSTFKAFPIAAAIEERTIRPDETFHCENGAWRVGRHTIHDTKRHDQLSVQGVLQVSSNICTAKIAQTLGRERTVRYYKAFGFGERTGLALPGEGRGVIPHPRAEITLATQSFGQGLTTTAVQLASAFGALANDGVLMRPYLVSRVVDPDGLVLLENRPTELRKVVSPGTARTVIRMMESVVEPGGTAQKAWMPEYRVSGKTGTAQKADLVAGGYSDKRIASFIGTVPAEAPRVVILVVVDEPKTDVYGGLVAAPAFREIAEAAMPHLAVPPSRAAPPPARKNGEAERLAKAAAAPPPVAVAPALTESPPEGTPGVRVPDLGGKAGREAVASLLSLSLEPRVEGTGRVVSQSPTAGSWVARGTKITVEMKPRP